MNDKTLLFTLISDNMRALHPFYREAMETAIKESGLPERWFALSTACGSDPAPISSERLHAMYPYSALGVFTDDLANLAQLDLLERVAEDAYRVTDLGRESVTGIYQAVHQALGEISPLPPDDMDRLNVLLYRLVKATLEYPEPEEKQAITYSRWTDPGENAPAAARTDQYLTDLYQFRDDAHIAAWKTNGASGPAWEALTFIWREEASTAGELVEKLPFRNLSEEDYTKALAELKALDWVEKSGEGYQITQNGEAIRQEAERATDRIYFAPWVCLSEGEAGQFERSLTLLKTNLVSLAKSAE